MAKKERMRIVRIDGKPINLVRRRGHLMVCAKGCCCGRTDRGFPAVPIDFFKSEYKRRKIRNRVQLTMAGCLGPCQLANVVLLFFDGRPVWFQSINHESQIAAIYDYVEAMLKADAFLPPPAELAEYVFEYYAWTSERRSIPLPTTLPRASAGFLFLTHADTDLLALRSGAESLPAEFPTVKGAGLAKMSAEHVEAMLSATDPRIVVLRVLGGSAAIPGLRSLAELGKRPGRHLVVLSGMGEPEPELAALSTVPLAVVEEATAYLQHGGPQNAAHLFRFLADRLLMTGFGYDAPTPQPQHGIYHPRHPSPMALDDWLARHFPPSPPPGFAGGEGTGVRGDSEPEADSRFREACRPPSPRPSPPAKPGGEGAKPIVGILFYRSHWMSGNLAFVDALVDALEIRGIAALPIFTASLKDGQRPAAFELFRKDGKPIVDVLITTVAFALGEVRGDGPTQPGWSIDVLRELDVPVLQAICAGTMRWQWEASPRGLNPLDTAMNVALPEFDGRIVTVPISFKEALGFAPSPPGFAGDPGRGEGGQNPSRNIEDSRGFAVPPSPPAPLPPQSRGKRGAIDAVRYAPVDDRIARVAGLAARFAMLRRKPNAEKRIVFVLTNAAGKAAKIGNAVGLDAPASLIRILHALAAAGYDVGDIPETGDALIHALIERCSYDETLLTEAQLAEAAGRVPSDVYRRWFAELPPNRRQQMIAQWGEPPGAAFVHDDSFAIAGLTFGNVFVALQPPRGYGMDPAAIYHQPDLPPTHHYLAFHRWLAEMWRADAIVHVGKHGTLEWLPGKGVGLAGDCFPDLFLGDMPLFYPFILNDPGEGAQAKRRGHAVIVDHLTPPMTTADGYGELAELMQLVDEYYQVELLDPSKMPILQQQIWDLIRRANLQEDLKFVMSTHHGDHTHEWEDALTADGTPVSLAQMQGRDVSHLIQELDGYLCELAGAQIRDGLHILGEIPEGDKLTGLLQALTRVPNLDVPSLRAAVAEFFGLDLDTILADKGARVACPELERLAGRPIATHADALETIDELSLQLLALVANRLPSPPGFAGGEGAGVRGDSGPSVTSSFREARRPPSPQPSPPAKPGGEGGRIDAILRQTLGDSAGDNPSLRRVLSFVIEELVPNLRRTTDEITNLLAGLDGRYVPAGPSGAPTRGMAHVLPTGRNFYAVDPRALPSAAACQVGQELAREVLDRYRRDTGTLPETVGISMWGTAAMRTSGDDIAEVLALYGVRPVRQKENRRVLGVEAIPLAELGRPRIDVTVRISGFFRDAFPHLIRLIDDAASLVALLDEPTDRNFVRKHYLADLERFASDERLAPSPPGFAGDPGRGEGGRHASPNREFPQASLFPLTPVPSPPAKPGGEGGNAERRAHYRVFGSKPGSYGVGLLPLIEERNWETTADLAETYVNWSGYAYSADGDAICAPETFRHRLAGIEVALHNQDNREHDLLDSDDYFQFHGGMIAAIRAVGGRPRHYFGDSHDPAHPRVRDLKEEVLRVFRSRVVNPKWLESIQRHGYKGGLEMAATVDYLFGYDATADVVDDWMYEQVAQSYALGAEEFLARSNPWALSAIAERLLEAAGRGLWSAPNEKTLAELHDLLDRAETALEARGEPAEVRP